MALTWQETRQGTLRIQDRASGVGIWIFGGFFTLVGLRFLWWLLLALGAMGQALMTGEFSYLVSNVVGVVLLAGITAVFLLPGLWFLFARSVMELDPVSGRVSEMRDYVVWRRTYFHDLADIQNIRGTHGAVRTSKHSLSKYRIDVVKKEGGGEFLAAQPDTREQAGALGALMAKIIGVPFEDATAEHDSYGRIVRQRQGMDEDGNYIDEPEKNS